jgi:hypothetical protein
LPEFLPQLCGLGAPPDAVDGELCAPTASTAHIGRRLGQGLAEPPW